MELCIQFFKSPQFTPMENLPKGISLVCHPGIFLIIKQGTSSCNDPMHWSFNEVDWLNAQHLYQCLMLFLLIINEHLNSDILFDNWHLSLQQIWKKIWERKFFICSQFVCWSALSKTKVQRQHQPTVSTILVPPFTS